jgi:hypothetical protein
VVTQAAAHQSVARTSSRGRTLTQQRKEPEHTEHLLALQNVPGVHLSGQQPATWASCAQGWGDKWHPVLCCGRSACHATML